MDKISNIIQRPTTFQGVHESIYRSYNTLQLVKKMLEQGDSQNTILMIICHIEDQNERILEKEDELPF